MQRKATAVTPARPASQGDLSSKVHRQVSRLRDPKQTLTTQPPGEAKMMQHLARAASARRKQRPSTLHSVMSFAGSSIFSPAMTSCTPPLIRCSSGRGPQRILANCGNEDILHRSDLTLFFYGRDRLTLRIVTTPGTDTSHTWAKTGTPTRSPRPASQAASRTSPCRTQSRSQLNSMQQGTSL